MTQEECRVEWNKLKAEIILRIREIDKETPAHPQVEPEWWVDMMDVLNQLKR